MSAALSSPAQIKRRRTMRLLVALALGAAVGLVTPAQSAAGAPSGPCVVSLSGVLGWWAGEGDLTAEVGPDLNGTTGFDTGVVGQSMVFNGLNQDVYTDDIPPVGSVVTVETWFRTTFNGTGQALVSKWGANTGATDDDSYTLWVTVNNQLVWQTQADFGSGQTFTIAITPQMYDGEWHHAAGVYDGGNGFSRLYLDGVLVASKAVSGPLNPAPTEPLRLGRFGGDPFPLVGQMDEPTVFNRALTDAEIQAIYEAGSDGKCGAPPTDTTAPDITVTSPADGSVHTLGATVAADYECTDEVGGSGVASCVGTVPVGSAVDTATVGTKTFEVSATDNAGNGATAEVNYDVRYAFSQFTGPVDPPPTYNRVKAGQSVPVQFSLGGDQGMSIIADGFPKSSPIECDSTAEVDGVETTATAGMSGLQYDAATDTYTYVWRTKKAWADTCRQFVLRLDDGSTHRANFALK